MWGPPLSCSMISTAIVLMLWKTSSAGDRQTDTHLPPWTPQALAFITRQRTEKKPNRGTCPAFLAEKSGTGKTVPPSVRWGPRHPDQRSSRPSLRKGQYCLPLQALLSYVLKRIRNDAVSQDTATGYYMFDPVKNVPYFLDSMKKIG